MANSTIQIDSSELIKFTNKLEKIGKYDLPVVARQTLNEMAFRMKGTRSQRGHIDKTAERVFENRRNKTLFRALTGFNKSQGNNINSMKSEAGIIKKPGREKLSENLAQHELHGNIKSKMQPISDIRVGGDYGKKVKPSEYANKNVPVDLTRNKGKRFNIRAIRAMKAGRSVMFKAKSGTRFVVDLKKLNRGDSGYRYKMKFAFKIHKNEIRRLDKNEEFLTIAAHYTLNKGNEIFVDKANKRIKRSFERR